MRVAVWMPVHTQVQPETSLAVLATTDALRAAGHVASLFLLNGESLLSRARNVIAATFLRSFDDVMLTIDSDVTFTPDDARALLAHDAPVVAANYARKSDGAPMVDAKGPGLVASARVPLGFTAIRRDALEDVIRAREREPGFPLDYYPYEDNPCAWGFFVPFVRDRKYFVDDDAFSYRLTRARVPLFVDTSLAIGHIGRTTLRVPR